MHCQTMTDPTGIAGPGPGQGNPACSTCVEGEAQTCVVGVTVDASATMFAAAVVAVVGLQTAGWAFKSIHTGAPIRKAERYSKSKPFIDDIAPVLHLRPCQGKNGKEVRIFPISPAG